MRIERAFLSWLVVAVLASASWLPAAEIQLHHRIPRGGDARAVGRRGRCIWQRSAASGSLAWDRAVSPSSRKFLKAREIQDVLVLRGVNLAENRLSGASMVELVPAGASTAPSKQSLPRWSNGRWTPCDRRRQPIFSSKQMTRIRWSSSSRSTTTRFRAIDAAAIVFPCRAVPALGAARRSWSSRHRLVKESSR